MLIKTDKVLIDTFKIYSFTYYRDNGQLSLFSFRHFLVLVMLNIQKVFIEKYGQILSPNEQYFNFYKKRGTKLTSTKEDKIQENINFLLPVEYAQLFYDLMHTYYIKEKTDSFSYSISLFFEFIVSFLQQNELEFFEIKM